MPNGVKEGRNELTRSLRSRGSSLLCLTTLKSPGHPGLFVSTERLLYVRLARRRDGEFGYCGSGVCASSLVG